MRGCLLNEAPTENLRLVNYGGGTVNKVPLGGGSVTTLASGQSGPLRWRSAPRADSQTECLR